MIKILGEGALKTTDHLIIEDIFGKIAIKLLLKFSNSTFL